MTFLGPFVLAVWAKLAGDQEKCLAALREAECILDAGSLAHNHIWFAQTAIDHAIAIGGWDDVERYATRLETYTREQPLAWSDFVIARGRALAAWGTGTRNETLATEISRLHDLAVRHELKLAAVDLERAMRP